MKRSLTRHLIRAINQTRRDDHPFDHGIHALVTFPGEAFADAPPPWNPGPGFVEQTGGSWLRENGDGTYTGVVCGVGPKTIPARDGGKWVEEEVWTMTSPDRDHFAHLDNKPHRITWHVNHPEVTVVRDRYPGHPQERWEQYWLDFERRYGFFPDRREESQGGGYYTELMCAPETWYYMQDASDIRKAVLWLARELGARARITGLVHAPKLRPRPYSATNPNGFRDCWPDEVSRLQSVCHRADDLNSAGEDEQP